MESNKATLNWLDKSNSEVEMNRVNREEPSIHFTHQALSIYGSYQQLNEGGGRIVDCRL